MAICRRQLGFTLPEVLVTVTITALILVCISGVFLASMRVWRLCSSQAQASDASGLAVYRINQELRKCCEVIEPAGNTSSDTLTFVLPRTKGEAGTADPDIPYDNLKNALDDKGNLIRGYEVTYYLEDDPTAPANSGYKVLWRREVDLADGSETERRIAEQVTDLIFTSYGSPEDTLARGQTFGVSSTAISVQGAEGATRTNMTLNAEVAIRNPVPL